jgi:hypothetical protein
MPHEKFPDSWLTVRTRLKDAINWGIEVGFKEDQGMKELCGDAREELDY